MRPQRVAGATTVRKTGCGKLYATISHAESDYHEVFFRLGKCGGCALSFLDGVGRLVSVGLNKPLTKDLIIRAFKGIRCPSSTHDGPIEVLSCLDAVAQLLEEENGNDSK